MSPPMEMYKGETNGLVNPSAYHDAVTRNLTETVEWNDPRLSKIIRLLSDPGFPAWDVSYCHGQLRDGTFVEVSLPFHQLPKRRVSAAIIAYAKQDKVFAKGLGIFSAISTLI